MYLPLESFLLRLGQLPLSLLGSDQPTLRSAVPDKQLNLKPPHARRLNLGSLTPYRDAPPFRRVSQELPDDCTVDQVILVSSQPGNKLWIDIPPNPAAASPWVSWFLELVNTLDEARDIIQHAALPPNLQFLKDGYEYDLVPAQLTAVGRKELFDHGVEFSIRYPTFWTDTLVSTTVQRVIDSAHYFGDGFFGPEVFEVEFLTTNDFSDQVSWLYPWGSCPNMYQSFIEAYEATELWAEKYVPPIAKRLSRLIPGLEFSLNDIRGALYACPYDLAAHETSPWCNVFTPRELRDFEYEIDLLLDGFSGHASRGDPGPLLGAIYVKKLVERLTDAGGNAEPLYLEFAHDLTILFVLSTMGLNKDDIPLGPTHVVPRRRFRTTFQTPFAANMVWEKFTCQESFQGPQVRLVLNGATFPLSICENSAEDRTYGSCSLDAFVQANEYSLSVEYHNEAWNATCELGN